LIPIRHSVLREWIKTRREHCRCRKLSSTLCHLEAYIAEAVERWWSDQSLSFACSQV